MKKSKRSRIAVATRRTRKPGRYVKAVQESWSRPPEKLSFADLSHATASTIQQLRQSLRTQTAYQPKLNLREQKMLASAFGALDDAKLYLQSVERVVRDNDDHAGTLILKFHVEGDK